MIYGYLCEDSALENFIDEVLIHLGPKTKCKKFIRHKDFCDNYKTTPGRNSSQVRKAFVDAAKRAIGTYDVDLFIVAYDYDDGDINQYDDVIKNHRNSIDNVSKRRSIFSIPIQCIEYWLWYVKYGYKEQPPKPNEIETDPNFNRHKAKSEVYDKALENGRYTGQSNETELKKAREILKKLDTDRLQVLSPSFKHFVEQIKTFCNNFSK